MVSGLSTDPYLVRVSGDQAAAGRLNEVTSLMTQKRLWEGGSTIALVAVLLLAGGAYARHLHLNQTLARVLANGNQHRSCVTVVRDLVRQGAEVNSRSVAGLTPLFFACSWGDEEVASELIARGAKVNSGSHESSPPIITACYSGNYRLIELLLDHGADPNAESNFGKTCLDIVRRKPRLVHLLKSRGARF